MGHVGGHVGSLSISEIISRGSIRGDDVARLARDVRANGIVDEAEADSLIEMHEACGVQEAAWPPFFVDAITDYIVNQAQPEGYVNAVNARWLLSRIAPDGHVRTRAGLDLLINVVTAARWAPVSLSCLALEQVLRAVRCGDGPLRADRGAAAGTITPAEVALLRRILCAFGSDGHVAITRAEADVLFAIDAALTPELVEPSWNALFAGAIVNVAMTASGYAIPTREAAFDATVPGASQPATLRNAYRSQSREERALARLERQRVEIITNEEILGEETRWLADRLSASPQPGRRVSPAMRGVVHVLATYPEAIDGEVGTALAIALDRASVAA